jgi:V/A-type H+-transporting ATPase subunit I
MKGFVYSLPMIGWIFLILGGGTLFLAHKLNPVFNIKIPSYIVIGIWGVLVFFFSNPKNIFASIGEGIWSVYTMATGRLGDLLSYIRLFALALSSSILGYVFNDLALQVLHGGVPVVSQLFFVVLLLFGHGINISLAALGSFVHPMRLTFVEFYMNNAGFTGGGKEYKPFKNKINY